MVRRKSNVVLALCVIVALSPGLATAEDLVAECAKIDDSGRRLECFDAVAKSAAAQASGPKLEELSRAGAMIVGAIEAGVSLIQLGDRIQSFGGEINASASQAVTANEKATIEKYRSALNIYVDSRRLWDEDINYNSGNSIHMPVPIVLVQDIANRYDLGTVNADILGLTRGIDGPTAIRFLWAKAATQIHEGDALLKDAGTPEKAK